MKLKKGSRFLAATLAALILATAAPVTALAETTTTIAEESGKKGTTVRSAPTAGKLERGGFENDEIDFGKNSSNQNRMTYYAIDNDDNPLSPWHTTATDKKIEIFQANGPDVEDLNWNGYFMSGSAPNKNLIPSEGRIAAELNGNEESTLYQTVSTSPSSIYEWGLDHGARSDCDTMALIIGPKQGVEPAKPNKDGEDQFMQMVDWLKAQNRINVEQLGIQDKVVIYSRPFAANGGFDGGSTENFSFVPTNDYTEEWHVWVMADATTGITGSTKEERTNAWTSYGSNSENGSADEYYQYTVPTGKTETIFAFSSVYSASNNQQTGNFLDNINFKLYHPLSGSASISIGTDGNTHPVSGNNTVKSYVLDRQTLTLKATVSAADAADGSEFAGVYYTTLENGKTVTKFLKREDATWTKTVDADGNITYSHELTNIQAAVDLHFVFIKSPTITYDANGGTLADTINLDGNGTYGFKPDLAMQTFQNPYVSQAPTAPEGWKFVGWRLSGDTVENIPAGTTQIAADKLGELILPAEHTAACDYNVHGVNGDLKIQYFKIWEGAPALTAQEAANKESVTYTADDNTAPVYANLNKGLIMTAQWRWAQTFVPQGTLDGKTWQDSDAGGTVAITGEDATHQENGANGTKTYYSAATETIKVKATAKDSYTFDGWYDENGALVSLKPTYSYTVSKDTTTKLYAHFVQEGSTVTKAAYKVSHIKLDKSGTEVSTDPQTPVGDVGSTVSATPNTYVGYVFDESNPKNKVSDTLADNGTELKLYYRLKKYNIHFDKDGAAENVTDLNDVYYGDPIATQTVTKSGYTFAGWYKEDGTKFEAATMPDLGADGATITLKAKWTANAPASLTYNVNGGFGSVQDVKGTDGEKITLSDGTGIARTGYTFKGWNTEANGTGAFYATGAEYTLNGDTTLYAKWELNEYPITYTNVDGATNNNPTEYTYESDVILLKEPIKEGYTFLGWTWDGQTDPQKENVTIPKGSTGNKVYNANWAENASLTYNANAPAGTTATGSVASVPDGYAGKKISVAQNGFEIPGYHFTGWNTKKDGTGDDVAADGNYTLAAGENTLYAQWALTNYNIHYENVTGATNTNPGSYNIKSSDITLQEPTKTGYTFDGWTYDGQPDPQKNVTIPKGSTREKTYTANWTPMPYHINYILNGGTNNPNNTQTTYTIEDNDIRIYDPDRAGYEFTGWTWPGQTTPQKDHRRYNLYCKLESAYRNAVCRTAL